MDTAATNVAVENAAHSQIEKDPSNRSAAPIKNKQKKTGGATLKYKNRTHLTHSQLIIELQPRSGWSPDRPYPHFMVQLVYVLQLGP